MIETILILIFVVAGFVFVYEKRTSDNMEKLINTVAMKRAEGKPENNNCKGPAYTNWEPVVLCPECLCEISHDEMMTSICLSCGVQFYRYTYINAASRKIYMNGSWREQLRFGGKDYIDKKRYLTNTQHSQKT